MVALTPAERSKRYRERLKERRAAEQPADGNPPGDSSAVTVTSPRDGRDGVTPDLGARGRRLWRDALADGPELRPAERVLLEEACRAADRLDQLDRQLRGDEDAWMRFRSLNEDGSVVTVVVNGLLAEARQQQIALKQILGELRQSRGVGETKPGRAPAPPSESPGGVRVAAGVTSLAARIAAKRSGTAAG